MFVLASLRHQHPIIEIEQHRRAVLAGGQAQPQHAHILAAKQVGLGQHPANSYDTCCSPLMLAT